MTETRVHRTGSTPMCDREHRKRRAPRWALVCIFAMAAATVVTSAPAGANHGVDSIFPSANYQGGDSDCKEHSVSGVCLADSRWHTVYAVALGSKMQAATVFTLDLSYDTTDINVIYHSTSQVTYSGSWETDVIYSNSNSLPSNVWGRNRCDDDSPGGGKCDQFYVLYHADKFDAEIPNDTTLQRAIACQETGHTVGMLHGSNSDPSQADTSAAFRCMRTNPLAAVASMGPHNINQVNGQY